MTSTGGGLAAAGRFAVLGGAATAILSALLAAGSGCCGACETAPAPESTGG
jgi:hypothetical protein